MKPSFKNDYYGSSAGEIFGLTLDMPVSRRFNIIGQLPYSRVRWEWEYWGHKESHNESAIGNLYLGLKTRPKKGLDNQTIGSFGIYLPTADEDKFLAYYHAISANFLGMFAYLPDILTVDVNVFQPMAKSGNFVPAIEGGLSVMIPTKSSGNGEVEFFAHYGFTGEVSVTQISLTARFAGIAILSEEVDKVNDRFINFITFGADWNQGRVQPGLFIQFATKKDMRESVKHVIGVRVIVLLK